MKTTDQGSAPPMTIETSLATLAQDSEHHGFTVVARYTGADGAPLGARFLHHKTKFTFDYLRIESAPQGFLWVNSFPTSDKGEPHTQEHLLLGKGDRGRKLGSSGAMALSESSAFTDQLRTAYHFHTVAANDVFWDVFGDQLDAMLNPDYSDEEIRREVRNFGVDKADDGTLHLEEKGTVYNEMVRTYENPDVAMWRTALRMLYGTKHPLSYDSGGEPAAIRAMTPEDIRTFHTSAYHLANMGMIAAFPSAMPLPAVLDRVGATLDQKAGRAGKVSLDAELPKPAPAPEGTIELVDYPFATPTNPGPMMILWPATRDLDSTERTALDLFLDAFAGDESTTLYKKLIDGKTRTLDTGANGVGFWHAEDQGEPLMLSLSGVRSDKQDAKTIADVRTLVLAELAAIAKLPDGDPALLAFNQLVASRIVDSRRQLAKMLDTPPGFGFRGAGAEWMNHLRATNRQPGFDKSLVYAKELATVEQLVTGTTNPWRDRIAAWGLLAQPFGLAAKPSPALRAKLDGERKQRITDELARLKAHYKTADDTATLVALAADEAKATAQLDELTRATPLPALVATPPMTKDDGLVYDTAPLDGTPRLRAKFDSMASARVTFAFAMQQAIRADEQYLLALFPTLLTDVGVIIDGTPVPPEEVRERLRKEILGFSAGYAVSSRSRRIELAVSGSGTTPVETERALAWMARFLTSPDWRLANLPRLRDVVDQALVGVRQRMTGPEEYWVNDPRDAWERQNDSLRLHVASFLTMTHDLQRVRWHLLDPQDAKVTKEVQAYLAVLATAATQPRAKLAALATALANGGKPDAKFATTKLSTPARELAQHAGRDLLASLPDLPDASLARDWSYLCKQMSADLGDGAPAVLASLERIRAGITHRRRLRIVEVGATPHLAAVAPAITTAVRTIPAPAETSLDPLLEYQANARLIATRLAEHEPALQQPTFVGLVAPSTSSGVFLNSAETSGYADTSDAAMIDYLAGNTYSGHGAHSMFMKTWAAGLAYSNGLRPDLDRSRIAYYAERCPLLPQTLRFVIEELSRAKPDQNIARYAIAGAFDSRVAASYEGRASAMAADLADGLTPEIVRTFRTRILEIAQRPDLATTLFARVDDVYARVLPGMGAVDPSATYFVIGPDKQLDAYAQYLTAKVSKTTKLYRLYPRDYWIPRVLK